MAKGEGGGGHWAERQAMKKRPNASTGAGTGHYDDPDVLRAIVKDVQRARVRPKPKPKVAMVKPRAKPAQPAMPRSTMYADKPRPPRIPGSAAGLPRVQTDSDPGTVYPVSASGAKQDRTSGGPTMFGNWDLAQQAKGQGLLEKITRWTSDRALRKGNLDIQRIKRRGLPIASME